MRIFRSIRWRFQLWLAFLLIAILSGFGVSAYQLHRQNRLELIDEELERRVSALNGDLRGRPPASDPAGRGRSGGPGFPPPRRFGPEYDSDSREVRPEPPWEPRNLQLSSRSLLLFDETDTNGFYFVIWTRDGT
ncbi:MAG: hypothetical protein KJ072_27585, partial [Verrucomicrobia bacterium]|nr:hypothetical protein [Verrucomicrobiota bacterium]